MAYNLIRDVRVFFTSNVDSVTGAIKQSGHTSSTTFEMQVLDGFTFSQTTANETVTINEAGATPTRGQRSFNTALNPVDFSFSTYIRPADDDSAVTGGTPTAEEKVLWNAMFSSKPLGDANAAWSEVAATVDTATTPDSITTPGYAKVVVTNSNVHQLQKFGLIISFDDMAFFIENCTLDTASIDFGLDAIATIAWTGKATSLTKQTYPILYQATAGNFVTTGNSCVYGAFKKTNTSAPYIANKLSTVVLKSTINHAGSGTKTYTLPITGGNINISNNVSYLTPANLGVVNQPCTYFTGTRAVTGSLNAYLKTGGTNPTATLLADMLDSTNAEVGTTVVDPSFELIISVGGASNVIRVDFDISAAVLTVPTINTEQVMGTTINFTAQGYGAGNTFDISENNEIEIKYYANTPGL